MLAGFGQKYTVGKHIMRSIRNVNANANRSQIWRLKLSAKMNLGNAPKGRPVGMTHAAPDRAVAYGMWIAGDPVAKPPRPIDRGSGASEFMP
jgi:hypothetical protein